MNDIAVIPRIEELQAKDWVIRFNSYRQANDLADSVALIWADWDVPENPSFMLYPNMESLTFSLLVFVPSRDDGVVEIAAQHPPAAIAWNDPPIYDTVSNYYYAVTSWNCADWKAWHTALEIHFGDTYEANAIWESAWQNDDNYCAVAGSFLCPDTAWCRYDCDFVKYLASKDVSVGNLLSNTTCDLSAIVLNIVRTVSNVTDGLETASKVLPWVAGGVVIWGGYNLVKDN